MRNFVIINGVNSNTINGLGINELPPITKPEMRNIREEIDGRDGDITTNLGYSAYDKTITIGLFGTGYDINDIVAFFNGEGTIVFSNEDDKYYKYKILNQIDYESLQKFRTASITFHCQPFKYPLSETPLEIEYDYIEDEGETLTLNNTGNATMKMDLKGNTSQASTPTPTSPVAVNVVSGDNEIVVCGKNLLNISNWVKGRINNSTGLIEYASNVSSMTISDNAISFTVSQAWNSGIASDFIPISEESYAITFSHNREISIYIDTYDNQKAKISRILSYTDSATPTTRTFTISDSSAKYIRIHFEVNTANVEYIVSNLQLELGTASTYEPYQSQTYPIDLPVENLNFTPYKDGTSKSTNGINFSVNDNGEIIANNTATSGAYFYCHTQDTTPYLNIPKGKYYLSGCPSGGGNNKYRLILRLYNDATYVASFNDDGSGVLVDTTSYTYNRILLFIEISSGQSCNNLTFKPQLEPGTKANSYSEYGTTPIELCKIGDYQDYFTKNSEGQWCKYNAIGKVVLNGTQASSGLYNGSTNTSRNIFEALPYNCRVYVDNILSKCNLFPYNNMWSKDEEGYFFDDNSKRIIVRISKATLGGTAQTDWNNWLSSHNLICYYALATPYLSLIEDNNLIEQLDNIQNAMSYEGTTNIGQVNNDKAFIISAKALEDGTNEVVVNNIGNVYSKPLIALEGSGNVDIYLDNTQILKANVEDKMNIDIAQLEAYNPDTMTLLNRQVIGNYNSMTLQPGNNTIRIDGALDKATITNYTRWL